MAKSMPELIRVKDKFQLTIPAAVRRDMGIAEGDFVEVRYADGEIHIKPRAPAAPASGADWYRTYMAKYPANAEAEALTDEDVNRMVHALR
jgi:AbrB family looped-hinge helix DNA binding protein